MALIYIIYLSIYKLHWWKYVLKYYIQKHTFIIFSVTSYHEDFLQTEVTHAFIPPHKFYLFSSLFSLSLHTFLLFLSCTANYPSIYLYIFGEAAGVPSLTDSIPVRISETLIHAGRHVIGFVDWAQAGTLTYTAGSVHAIGHGPLWGQLSICIHFSLLIMCFLLQLAFPQRLVTKSYRSIGRYGFTETMRLWRCISFSLFKSKNYVIFYNLWLFTELQSASMNK